MTEPAPEELPASLFVRDGDTIVPTAASRGPWADDALHGGPTTALLAHLCETHRTTDTADVAMQTSRLTVELLAPVPLAPLTPRLSIIREGRKIRLVQADLIAGDRLVATARLAQIRTADRPLPTGTASLEGPRLVPSAGPAKSIRSSPTYHPGQAPMVRYHSHATEHRFARGSWVDLGPSFDWVRLLVPVLPDVSISPLVRVAAAADFGNGVSAPLPFDSWLFINPDLTVHLHRMPQGEWVALDTHCYVEPNGVGQSNTELFDEVGRIGHGNQSLLLDSR